MAESTERDWDREAAVLAAEALAAGRPTEWFDRLYAAARRGEIGLPWDLVHPNTALVEWAENGRIRGDGRTAVVVGAGLGRDAEYVGGLGFDTTAFDVSDNAITVVKERHPDSPVHYTVADLFDLPAVWSRAFDLVVESFTVQALPVDVRQQATAAVAGLVAPGGTLLAIANAREDGDQPRTAPPWPLTRAEIDAFATDGLVPVTIDRSTQDAQRWRAEFRR